MSETPELLEADAKIADTGSVAEYLASIIQCEADAYFEKHPNQCFFRHCLDEKWTSQALATEVGSVLRASRRDLGVKSIARNEKYVVFTVEHLERRALLAERIGSIEPCSAQRQEMIQEFVKTLWDTWALVPQMRLGQLIVNALRFARTGELEVSHIFYAKDLALERALENFLCIEGVANKPASNDHEKAGDDNEP